MDGVGVDVSDGLISLQSVFQGDSNWMKSLLFLIVLFVAGSSSRAEGATPKSSLKPNIIFILADDLGVGNVGCYGSDHYRTPNIDRLAAQGTRFTRSFTAALCGPSRLSVCC